MVRRVALAALAALAACTATDGTSCPGVSVSRFDFALATSAGADVDGDGTAETVSGCLPDGDVPAGTFTPPVPGEGGTNASFVAKLTLTSTGNAALCVEERFAEPRFGDRTGDAYRFDDVTFPDADLSACGPRCPVAIVQKLGGALCAPDRTPCPEPATGGLEFRGWVVDEFVVPENAAGSDAYDCGQCRGTCRAVYDLAGTALP
jgi:hypothetical protein